MAGLAPKLPLTPNKADGYELLQSIKDVVKQNMKNLILTSPGERVMDPLFGVGLRGYLFEMDTDLVKEAIKQDVNEQVKKYLPFVELLGVFIYNPSDVVDSDSFVLDFEPGLSSNTLRVRIVYSIIPLATEDMLDLGL